MRLHGRSLQSRRRNGCWRFSLHSPLLHSGVEQLQRFQVYFTLQLGIQQLTNQTFGFNAQATRLERRADKPINHRTTVRHDKLFVAGVGGLGQEL